MSIVSRIKANPKFKKIALRMLIPNNDHKPRLWVRWFLNPFIHTRKRGAVVRWKTRMDLFPFNKFILGRYSTIEDFAVVNNGVGDVLIGDNTIIGIGCTIIGPVSIGNDVMLAQNIVISGLNHGYEDISISPAKQKVSCKQITIADDVWIGANSVIVAGVTIGRHSVIGAGSVVTKNIPDYSVAVGNPARVVKRYNSTLGIWESTKNA